MYSLGIDVGYSSVKAALVDSDGRSVGDQYVLHHGHIGPSLMRCLEALLADHGPDDVIRGAVTGSGSRFLAQSGIMTFANEVAAIVEGSLKIDEHVGSIVEIGGRSAKYITGFSKADKSRIQVSMNSSCSAGTGSFLEEQASRLELKLEDYSLYASRAKTIPRIAGRCSVFAKTDIIHHQQKGTPIEDILLGLAYAVIRNYRVAVMKKLPKNTPLLFVGGAARNQAVATALKSVLSLEDEELIVPERCGSVAAIGAALIGMENGNALNVRALLRHLAEPAHVHEDQEDGIELPSLASFGESDSAGKHRCITPKVSLHDRRSCYLGVDVGSTSTNLVLIDDNAEIIDFRYLRTLGNPVKAVSTGLRELGGKHKNTSHIVGVGVTGSGRHMIAKLIGADCVKDEITAQAKAAVTMDADVDTIFEIGGQDSKYIGLRDGVVTDFQMNKVCAAGTGSFVEEQARKFDIPLDTFGDLALNSTSPINLGERCTVFIETSIASHLARGAKVEDIAAGLCCSIVKNYLNRVVGQKPVGERVFLQGGIAYNQGIVNAFRALTGKHVEVPPFFSVSGAYGAAILAKEEMGSHETHFRGFTPEPIRQLPVDQPRIEPIDNAADFDRRTEQLIFQGYNGSLDGTKQTVGIPRALFTFGMFPMFSAFFWELGFNVLLSDPTSEETIRLGQEYSLDETCYPVKLINGHVAQLVQKKVDYIFFPDLHTVDHPRSPSRQNYGCAYMQLAFKMVNQAMGLDGKGIKLLAPTIAFSFGKEFMMQSFSRLGEQLDKAPEQTAQALQAGMKAFHAFEKRMEEHGKEALATLAPDEKAFVIISKIYGVADRVLNMGIPRKLMDMGYKVLGFYDLPEVDISQEHPNMYWPFGQHILEPAQLIRQHPNLYAVLLTHHGCGPDSVLSHYFREMMGGKPYLQVEVDEHCCDVGVATRVEAFVNSLSSRPVERAKDMEVYSGSIVHGKVNIKTRLADLDDGTTLFIPHVFPYSEILAAMLVRRGVNAKVLPRTDKLSIDIGRRFTLTNEYFSLTALLGDVFKKLRETNRPDGHGVAFLVPQNEGAEVDGQYGRLLRSKLDEEGFARAEVFSPFMEDALFQDEGDLNQTFLGLLAGDLINHAQHDRRHAHLRSVLNTIEDSSLTVETLETIAAAIREEMPINPGGKRLLVTGEPMVVFNECLNDSVFRRIEGHGHRVIHAPLSEALWMMWTDYAAHAGLEHHAMLRQRLEVLKRYIDTIAKCLSNDSPFERNLNGLVAMADATVGYYAGAHGRYRQAKVLGNLHGIDGIITATSTYENTGITLNVLQRAFEKGNAKPRLDLVFDGNRNDNDRTRLESFLYYLAGHSQRDDRVPSCKRGHCHTHHGRRRGPSSFWMHDPQAVFGSIQLKKGDRLLDLGCGPGDYACHASQIVGHSGMVYAIDKSEQFVGDLHRRAASEGLDNIKTIVSDITRPIPLDNGCVDACLMVTVLHILDLAKDGETLFNEARRVLKPGGRVAIIDCKKENTPFGPPRHMRVSADEVEKSITQFGFRKTGVIDLGNNYLVHFVAE